MYIEREGLDLHRNKGLMIKKAKINFQDDDYKSFTRFDFFSQKIGSSTEKKVRETESCNLSGSLLIYPLSSTVCELKCNFLQVSCCFKKEHSLQQNSIEEFVGAPQLDLVNNCLRVLTNIRHTLL